MNNKAQIFTLATIIILGLLFASFEIFSITQHREAIKTRVSTMDSFLFSIEQNLQRQMYISGFRIIFLAEDSIAKNGTYINVNSFFNEAFFNGSINGLHQEIMDGATYSDIFNSISQKAENINVNISLLNSSIIITQEDPWNVKFILISSFVMQDKTGLAKWEKTQIISANIPVENFEDPIFIINTNALISRKINKTIYQGIYTNGNDVANLLDHLNKGYYAANPLAPSFLNRLSGNFSADSNGIESFVKISDLAQQGLPTFEKSAVDYIYFSSSNPEAHQVSGMPSWFRLDRDHLSFYNATSLAI